MINAGDACAAGIAGKQDIGPSVVIIVTPDGRGILDARQPGTNIGESAVAVVTINAGDACAAGIAGKQDIEPSVVVIVAQAAAPDETPGRLALISVKVPSPLLR